MPPSKESQALTELFKSFAAAFPPDGEPYLARCIYDQVQRAGSEAPGVSYEDVIIAGRPCKWVRPSGASSNHVILFIHGGGYSFGSPNGHRKLASHLAKASNCLSLMIDYRKTPEHPYPAALEDCVAAYQWLLDQGISASHIVTAGDSCGGGLSTTVPLATIAKGLPRPGAAVALSPWYDLTVSGDSMATNEQHDAINTRAFVNMLAERYTQGGASRADPLISPLFADLKDLPPHWISCGGYDMLLDDGVRLAEKAKKQGVEVVLEVHEGQQHVFEFMVGRAPEADNSIKRIGEWVRQKIGS